MSRILLVGATGGVGHRLLPLLIARGHEVTALHRNPDQAEALRQAGATPAHADLMEIDGTGFVELAKGHDVIVFSAGAAGSGLERTAKIDGDGPLRMIDAARAHGISRLYLVSAMPDAGRGKEPNETFEFYMQTKKNADSALAATAFDWVILRPGTLIDSNEARPVALSPALPYASVSRGSVAMVLAELIDRPSIRREILELTDGSTPITAAVGALART